jgi:hypothetical protein
MGDYESGITVTFKWYQVVLMVGVWAGLGWLKIETGGGQL